MVQKTTWTLNEQSEEILDFFDLVAKKVFTLDDSIKLSIAKTLSRKSKEDDIMSIKRILTRYIDEQKQSQYSPSDPEFQENQEIIQKLGIFFDDLNDPKVIYDRKEAYLASCFAALSELTPPASAGGYEEKRGTKVTQQIDADFITQNLLREFPKTLMSAIRLIISKLNGKSMFLILKI